MPQLLAMRVFVTVADTRSFTAAAQRLRASPAAMTRAVAALERQLGARLFTRTTRTVRLTEIGERFADDCRRILADLADAESVARGAQANPTGHLRVTASVLFGQMHLLPIVTEYLDLYPEVTVDALFVDRVVNLIEEGVDVAVRIGHLSDSNLVAVQVGSVRRVVCASRAYLAAHGTPQTPSDLADHQIIGSTGAFSSNEWRFGRGEKSVVRISPRLSCSTFDAVIRATEQGWGLARPLSYQIGRSVLDGHLRIILQEFEEDALPIHVVYSEGRRASAKVRAFVDLAADRLRDNPALLAR